MTEKLQCLGSVRNFCNLPCLLQYCYVHFETSQRTSNNGTGMVPQTPLDNLCYLIIHQKDDADDEYLNYPHVS